LKGNYKQILKIQQKLWAQKFCRAYSPLFSH